MALLELPAARDLVARLRSPEGQKLWRYSVASAVAVVVSVVCLVIFNGLIGLSAVVSSTLATSIAAIPNYYMNRKWAWGKSGRSHLLKEVVPFWALAFAGWAFSTYSVHLMEDYAKGHNFAHFWSTVTVAIVYIGAFGILWVAKFIIFNKLMFVHHHHTPVEHAPAEQAPPAQGGLGSSAGAPHASAANPNPAVKPGDPAGLRVPG